jgi:hypothetical protein
MACGLAIPTKIRMSFSRIVDIFFFDRFSFFAFLGWQNEQDHYDAMKKDAYKEFRGSFKDCINGDKDKGIKIYHIELAKVYGDL